MSDPIEKPTEEINADTIPQPSLKHKIYGAVSLICIGFVGWQIISAIFEDRAEDPAVKAQRLAISENRRICIDYALQNTNPGYSFSFDAFGEGMEEISETTGMFYMRRTASLEDANDHITKLDVTCKVLNGKVVNFDFKRL